MDFYATTPAQVALNAEATHHLRRLGAGLTALEERADISLTVEWASGPHRCSRYGDSDLLIGVSFHSGDKIRRRLRGRAVLAMHRTVGGAASCGLVGLRLEVQSASGDGSSTWQFDLQSAAEKPVTHAWEGDAIDPLQGGIPLPWRKAAGCRIAMEALASMAMSAVRGDRLADLAVAGHGLTEAASAATAWLGEAE